MGKKQRDCVTCGAPVGYLDRRHCCRWWRRMNEQAARRVAPAAATTVSCSRAPAGASSAHASARNAATPSGHRRTVYVATADAGPNSRPLRRPVRAAAGPAICAKRPAGAVTVPGPGRRNSRREPAASAVSCDDMPDWACARPAGSDTPAVPSSAGNTFTTASPIRPHG